MDRHCLYNACMYYVDNDSTIREASSQYYVDKSTLHRFMVSGLKAWDIDLYNRCCELRIRNKQLSHIRGGAAVKAKYAAMHKEKSL